MRKVLIKIMQVIMFPFTWVMMQVDKLVIKRSAIMIDWIFCLLSVAATVDYFIRNENREGIQGAFILVALYAFVVSRRIKAWRKLYYELLERMPNSDPTK